MALHWPTPGCFDDVRVIEIGDEKGEFCGRLLSGEGCAVIKVEPPEGSPTRRTGPFYQGRADPNRSLFFWMYNRGKCGVVLDLNTANGRRLYLELAARADVVVDAQGLGVMDGLGVGYERVREANPSVVYCSITPFGLTGPWRHFKASDLVHLALGGSAYCIGYNPANAPETPGMPATEAPRWDTPPFMPQMWHAYCIAGEHGAIAVAAALLFHQASGQGQLIDVSIHDACAHATEATVPRYIYYKMDQVRRTPSQAKCADGVYVNFLLMTPARVDLIVETLAKAGFGEGLGEAKQYADAAKGYSRQSQAVVGQALRKWAATRPSPEVFRALQACRACSAPVYRPEDAVGDPQAIDREDFVEIEHPELGRSFVYPRHPRRQQETPWRWGPRAPLLGEHTEEVLREMGGGRRRRG